MSTADDLPLACKCGKVRGVLHDASPSRVNRVVCYCADCQAFAHFLERPDLLDEHGGSDIVQVAPGNVVFHQGVENIAAVRLGPKGPFRWYATCCKTPLGNTVQPSLPFVGFVHEVFQGKIDVFGPPTGKIWAQEASSPPPNATAKVPVGLIATTVRKILGWKLVGKAWPNPFFERGRAVPRYPVRILERSERDALRAKCGPRTAAATG